MALALDGLHTTRPIEFPVRHARRGRLDVRRPHLREGRQPSSDARAVPRHGTLPRRRPPVPCRPPLRQHRDDRPVGRDRRGRRGTSDPRTHGLVDLPGRTSARDRQRGRLRSAAHSRALLLSAGRGPARGLRAERHRLEVARPRGDAEAASHRSVRCCAVRLRAPARAAHSRPCRRRNARGQRRG